MVAMAPDGEGTGDARSCENPRPPRPRRLARPLKLLSLPLAATTATTTGAPRLARLAALPNLPRGWIGGCSFFDDTRDRLAHANDPEAIGLAEETQPLLAAGLVQVHDALDGRWCQRGQEDADIGSASRDPFAALGVSRDPFAALGVSRDPFAALGVTRFGNLLAASTCLRGHETSTFFFFFA
jgi:hypothetical protein